MKPYYNRAPVERRVRHMTKNEVINMNITLETMIQKHNACVLLIDEAKHCETCRYKGCTQDAKPCSNCYNELLGIPVNPTNWEASNAQLYDNLSHN